MRWVFAVIATAAACGDNLSPDEPYYARSSERTLGAFSLDRMRTKDDPVNDRLEFARDSRVVVLFYGHLRPRRTTPEAVDELLTAAEANGLPTVTFADLDTGKVAGPALCLSFDDTEVDAWHDELLPILRAHQARVSFFVTKFPEMGPEQRAKLHELYAEGNSIEAHGIHHLYADQYLKHHDVASYVRDEVTPSFEMLRADGFAPVAFAYPGGAHTEELDEAILDQYPMVRTISGHPQ